MKRVVQALAICGIVALLGGCSSTSSSTDILTSPGTDVVGSGNVATESRAVAGFNAVSVTGAAHLILEQTGVESLQITTDDNLLALIRSEVVGGALVIGFEPGVDVRPTREILYRVTVRDLRRISISGVSRAEVLGIETEELTTEISGVSSATALGSAAVHRLTLSGVSEYEAPDLQSREVTANLSGVSHALIRVSDTLTAQASGASTLQYIGHPIVDASTTGGSTIRRVEP